jgi:hypothetical protein
VFPGSLTDGVLDLFTWNATSTWKGEYGDLTSGCLFFAEDAFGFQFCFKGDWVCTFDAETGKVVQLARTLEEWSTILLSGFREVLGHPLMVVWQQVHGALVAGARLAPRTPFVLGGTFDVANLYAADQVELMRFRGSLATQIRDLPDGSTVVVKVVP